MNISASESSFVSVSRAEFMSEGSNLGESLMFPSSSAWPFPDILTSAKCHAFNSKRVEKGYSLQYWAGTIWSLNAWVSEIKAFVDAGWVLFTAWVLARLRVHKTFCACYKKTSAHCGNEQIASHCHPLGLADSLQKHCMDESCIYLPCFAFSSLAVRELPPLILCNSFGGIGLGPIACTQRTGIWYFSD